MDLIQKYLVLVTDVVSFNEYDKISVNAYNCKAMRMRRIAIEIEHSHPNLKDEFCKLLLHDNDEIRLWAAHHILEVMSCDPIHRKTALKVIRHKAGTDKTANGFGEKMWLKEWYKSHPKDRWI